MNGPLAGIRIIEVAMWAFVPAAGGMLADMGATVLKIEPPTGDPLRGLRVGTSQPGDHGFVLSWESYNRGKQSITLDLRQTAGQDIFYSLLEGADVLLTNLLPSARQRMGISVEQVRARYPDIIYALGSGVGAQGPEADKGGYDAISYWARAGIASSLTAENADYPVPPPGPAFGDTTAAAMLAGGVAAAVAQRLMTGHAPVVDVSLLATGMWQMQRSISEATLGESGSRKVPRDQVNNPLVNTYRTLDGRFIALCMLQSQRYWAPFCLAADRTDLAGDPRFAQDADRRRNVGACVAELDALFAGKSLADWRQILARQEGQWDIVQNVAELADDPQVRANRYIQPVDYGAGRIMPMVSTPIQFDGSPLAPRPAPALGENSEEILTALGYSEDEIIGLKIADVVF
jgi:crotonobetainyl-CoA:carnitine CoA-transferase CaiB-like acyl-CoA transferase